MTGQVAGQVAEEVGGEVARLLFVVDGQQSRAAPPLMDAFLPAWRLRRDELDRSPLAHEEWTY